MEKDLSSEFLRIMERFRKLKYNEFMEKSMHQGEYRMLFAIDEYLTSNENNNTGLKVSDLAEHMCATRPAVSKMLNVLEQKGLIERISDKEDRRSVYVRLTESGEVCVSKGKQTMDQFMVRIIEQLGEKDIKALVRVMNHIYEILSDELNNKNQSEKQE